MSASNTQCFIRASLALFLSILFLNPFTNHATAESKTVSELLAEADKFMAEMDAKADQPQGAVVPIKISDSQSDAEILKVNCDFFGFEFEIESQQDETIHLNQVPGWTEYYFSAQTNSEGSELLVWKSDLNQGTIDLFNGVLEFTANLLNDGNHIGTKKTCSVVPKSNEANSAFIKRKNNFLKEKSNNVQTKVAKPEDGSNAAVGYKDIMIGDTVSEIIKHCVGVADPKGIFHEDFRCYGTDDLVFEFSVLDTSSNKRIELQHTGRGNEIFIYLYPPKKPEDHHIIDRITVFLGTYEDRGIFELKQKLATKYGMDWEYTERDRKLFNAGDKKILWNSFANGQVILAIYGVGNINLQLIYLSERAGQAFMENKRPRNSSSSDF